MLWLIGLTVATYFITFFNGFISDDITIGAAAKSRGYGLKDKKNLTCFTGFFDALEWRLLKDKKYLHHIVSVTLFTILTCSFYLVSRKFIPEPVAWLATAFFIVHPCNTQIGGWISCKWWGVANTFALWALFFNNSFFYVFSALFACSGFPYIWLFNVPWWEKILASVVVLFILNNNLGSKVDLNIFEGEFKEDNTKIYPRKAIVMLKSYCYYISLAVFPVQMGWFHELGEPIDDKLKSFDFHFVLCVLLIGTLVLFCGTKAFMGLLLFTLFIAPFTNLITFALFTSERYMTPAMMGWSIFLAYTLISYPIAAGILIAIYFMRTQLQLWTFRDDFHLAMASLISFDKSGYAWTNFANMMLYQGKPSAAFDILKETEKRLPGFPTTYWLLYTMYRANDLLNDYDQAYHYISKTCKYGKHEQWHKERETFRLALLSDRVVKFKVKYVTGKIAGAVPTG